MTPENSKITKKLLKSWPSCAARASGTHLVLSTPAAHLMSTRLRQVIAWWFVLQIVLPFTAPLQTLDVHDLFGVKHHGTTTSSPESTTTPTIGDASSATAAVSVLTPCAADSSLIASAVGERSTRSSNASAGSLLPTPQVQRSVLRL